MRIVFPIIVLLLLVLGSFAWSPFGGAPTSLSPPFDPATQIRIEFPRFGGGVSQGVSPILHEEWSGPVGFSYEIRNNVLEHENKHYVLKTGNIVRFEAGGVITIDRKPAVSVETIVNAVAWAIRGTSQL